MSAKLKVAVVLALVLTTSAILAGVLVRGGGASQDGARISNRGGPAIAMHGLRLKLAPIRFGRVLAVRHGRALYRMQLVNGTPCFGVGPAAAIGTPGSVVCPHGGFPSSGDPVLDLSVYEGTRRDVRDFSLFRVEGIAADGVAAVHFLRPSGELALSVPVSGNVYSAASVPPGSIAGFAAVDKDGKRLSRSP
jgi:hypothetical protein